MTLTKEQLFANQIDGKRPVKLPGVGTVWVRPLSRTEVLEAQDEDLSTAAFEYLLVSMAMVDPELTVDDVRRWASVSPAGHIEKVVSKIRDLSGLNPGADREAYKSAPDTPDAGVGDESGAAHGDDAGAAAGDD